MPKITWTQLNKTIEVPAGTTILDAALDHGIPLEHACGGFCACTTCHVKVLSGADNLSHADEVELERVVSADAYDATVSRLGCQTQVLGDVTLEIPTLAQ